MPKQKEAFFLSNYLALGYATKEEFQQIKQKYQNKDRAEIEALIREQADKTYTGYTVIPFFEEDGGSCMMVKKWPHMKIESSDLSDFSVKFSGADSQKG